MEQKKEKAAKTSQSGNSSSGGSGASIYAVGMFGAVIYFVQHGIGFWGVALGILKAMVWPAFVVYSLLDFLKL